VDPRIYCVLRSHAFLVFWVAGCVSVLVDGDHLPEAVTGFSGGRPLHLFWGVAALVCGLYCLMVLMKEARVFCVRSSFRAVFSLL
jgi:hypothetical protein